MSVVLIRDPATAAQITEMQETLGSFIKLADVKGDGSIIL
jgi:hypothetical protein